MPYLLLPEWWRRQPQYSSAVDWNHPLARNLLFSYNGYVGEARNAGLLTQSGASGLVVGATPSGRGLYSDGNVANYAQYTLPATTTGTSAVTYEVLLYASSFPSLAATGGLTGAAPSGSIMNTSGAAGLMRGVLSFTGTAPLDIYFWSANNDYDTDTPFEANKLQHLVVTKAAGTGACQITVYRNGVLAKQGNSSNGGSFDTTGPYFYLFGRHSSATATITGTIVKSAVYDRLLDANEAKELYVAPWQIYRQARSRTYFFTPTTGGAVTATSAITIGAITASSAATVAVAATSATTIPAVTVSSAAGVAVAATSAATIADVTVSSAAAVAVAATSAVTVDNLTVTSAVTVADGPLATLDATIAAITVASAATVDVAATSAVTIDAITVASAASVAVVATSTPSVEAVTLSSAAVVSTGPEAALAATIGAITVASSATVEVLATVSGTFDPITLLAEANNGMVEVRGVVPAGAPGPSGRKKYRKPRPMRRVQIGDRDYLIPEKEFPAFMEAMLRKQPPPPSVEVEPAPAPKPKAAPKAKPKVEQPPVVQAFNDAVLEPEVEELREAVEEHRPDLLPQFYEQALQAYIERTVQGEVARAIASIQPYLQASIALQTEVRDTVRTLRRDLADDMHALGLMID